MTTIGRRSFLAGVLGLPVEAGIVDLQLEAEQRWIEIGGTTAFLFSFNGQIPGPVIEARPGDHVRIQFRNSLRESANLHFHGLHVTPAGNGDNSFLEVPAGESLTYEFDIPDSHAGATCWYHPHMHGSVARQVSRGLAGAFLIRGELDQIPEIAAAPETVLLLQDFALTGNGLPIEPSPMERMTGRQGALVTANGQTNPRLRIERAGWLRMRLVNASSSRFYRLQLQEHPFQLIGVDGGALPAPEQYEEITLAPGERADVMVQGDQPGDNYRLLSLPYDRGGMGASFVRGSSTGPRVLATLAYQGHADRTWSLPRTLLAVDPLPPPSVERRFVLGQGMGMGMAGGGGGVFTINGRAFNPGRVDTRVALDAVEQWEFVNPTAMDHPMHIHTNPFQVIGQDGLPLQAWKDTVVVPAHSRLLLRTAFRDFPGLAVYHCHILDHEDLGMMGVLHIQG